MARIVEQGKRKLNSLGCRRYDGSNSMLNSYNSIFQCNKGAKSRFRQAGAIFSYWRSSFYNSNMCRVCLAFAARNLLFHNSCVCMKISMHEPSTVNYSRRFSSCRSFYFIFLLWPFNMLDIILIDDKSKRLQLNLVTVIFCF